jgi:hypothetical protein
MVADQSGCALAAALDLMRILRMDATATAEKRVSKA